MKKSFEERFWSRVERGAVTSCWPWQGARVNNYGVFNSTDYGPQYAHRLSFALAHGWEELKAKPNYVVGHKCDNPLCVNPRHLELISAARNSHDATKRGRKGTAHKIKAASSLSDDDIRTIRKTILTNKGIGLAMARYNIGEATVINIVRRKYHVNVSD